MMLFSRRFYRLVLVFLAAHALPFGAAVTHVQWEMKVVGLMIIFTYAFFKFAW